MRKRAQGEMVNPETPKEIAAKLKQGAGADIWYDAYKYDDSGAEQLIGETQDAMLAAADILEHMND